MAQAYAMQCCGVGELSGVSAEPALTLQMLINSSSLIRGNGIARRGAFIFTSNSRLKENYGTRLAAFITTHKLGTVTSLDRFTNPNTGNPITIFVWYIDAKAVVEYCRINRIAIPNLP